MVTRLKSAIVSMIMEVALESNKRDNDRVSLLQEGYQYIDSQMWSRRVAHEDTEMPNARLTEALTVADFPLYFNRVVSRGIYARYNYQTSDWRDYMHQTTLPDYSAGTRGRIDEFAGVLDMRREKQESGSSWLTEQQISLQVADYSKQVDFSHVIFVNDDLGAFDDVITKLGDSAKRFEDFFASTLYDNALTQAGLIALGANYAGVGRLTTAWLGVAWNAFSQRVDVRGNRLHLVPKYLVVPTILERTANQILTSDRIAELATNGNNPMRGIVQIKVDPYIGFTLPNVPWYLVCAPADIATVEFVRLQGTAGPRIYAKAPDKVPMTTSGGLGTADWRTGSFISGDIEIEVETTIGQRSDSLGLWVGVTDVQGIYYSTGVAP